MMIAIIMVVVVPIIIVVMVTIAIAVAVPPAMLPVAMPGLVRGYRRTCGMGRAGRCHTGKTKGGKGHNAWYSSDAGDRLMHNSPSKGDRASMPCLHYPNGTYLVCQAGGNWSRNYVREML